MIFERTVAEIAGDYAVLVSESGTRTEVALALLPDMCGGLDAFLQKRFTGCQPDRKERDRAAQALLRRGHRWDDVRAALDRYCASCGEQLEENEDYEL